MGHMNIKRIVHRVKEELWATVEVTKVLGMKSSCIALRGKMDIQIMVRNGHVERENYKRHLIHKHDVMTSYFQKTFKNYLSTYCPEKNYAKTPSVYADCIWICWWQGLQNAPNIVKRCVESIQKNAGNHRVIIITEDNYRDYIDVPNWVEEKKKAGIITRTNYSDLLRLSLLAKHGGMWLDSTFFCANESLEDYFNLPVWSIKRPDYRHSSVAQGYFAGYSLACNEENRYAFSVMRDLFLHYWETNEKMVDYLLIDYMIVLAQKIVPSISVAFKNIPSNNPNCDELLKVLERPYDEQLWNKLKKDTKLFKLTWKANYPVEVDGKTTFYGKLISGELI